jgi:uncharacterized protein (TIGR00304 family)
MFEWNFLITIGFISIILGTFIVVFWTIAQSLQKYVPGKEETFSPGSKRELIESIRSGAVVMIGPIPIVFGSDKKYAMIAMILAIALMLLAIIFGKSLLHI